MSSTDHQEEEIKLTFIEQDGIERLMDYLGEPERILKQTNTYYDTPTLGLRQERVMLRVRKENDDLVITAKSRAKLQRGGLRAREVEYRVDLQEGMECLGRGLHAWEIPPVTHALSFLSNPEPFAPLGSTDNIRVCYPWRGGTLELDRTFLPDGTEHTELEFETPCLEEELSRLQSLLQSLQIPFTDEVIPKYVRFLQALEPG